MSVAIWGNQELARVMNHYSPADYFIVDEKYKTSDTYLDKPVKIFSRETIDLLHKEWRESLKGSKIEDMYTPETLPLYLPIGYKCYAKRLNGLREAKFNLLKSWKYSIMNFVHTATLIQTKAVGEGNILLELVNLQTGSSIKDGNILWSNCHIGHGSSLGSWNWVTTGVVICGQVSLKDNNFVGANAVISPGVEIGSNNLICAGAILSKSIGDNTVVFPGVNQISDKKPWEIKLS